MPVVKNDYNIYKSNRNRRVSECSNDKTSSSSASSCGGTRRVHSGSRSADGPSLSTSPGSDFMVGSPAHRSLGGVSKQTAFHHGSLQHHHGAASRNSSRNSQSSLQSPAKSSSSSSSPPKVSSTSSLNMFHSKLVDKLRRSLTSKSKDNSTTTASSKDIARRRSWDIAKGDDHQRSVPNLTKSAKSRPVSTMATSCPLGTNIALWQNKQ